jgi:membrane protein implicated in regulation of membrane protease activity
MSGLDWNLAAVSASASAAAAVIAVAVGLRRRRRSQTTGGADALPERRIEVVAIGDAGSNPEEKAHP